MPHPDFPSNCLRPHFTQKIVNWLERGYAINVAGTEGQGIGRLVEDLAYGCPNDVQLVRLSMRSFAYSYSDFLQALADALGIELAEVDIRRLINNYLGTNDKKIWLCLEQFDRLAEIRVDNKQVDTQGYDIHFLNYLNSLRNNPRVALLVCSVRELGTQELYIGGKRVPGSSLEFSERTPLQTLTFENIEAYLARRMPDTEKNRALFAQKPVFYTELITEIDAHPDSVSFADYLAEQSFDPSWLLTDFRTRFSYWKSQYSRHHAPTFDKRLGNFEKDSQHWLSRVGRMLGITKIWRNIGMTLKITLFILVGIAAGGWKWIAQAWTFIASLLQK